MSQALESWRGALKASSMAVLALLLFVTASPGLRAQEPAREVRDVEVKVHLIDINSIDSVNQSFVADLTLVIRWHDPALRHAGPDSMSKDLDDIWYPRTLILNQQQLVRSFPRSVEVQPDGWVIYRQRVWGSFSQPLELRQFPFDTQRLQINLGNIGFGSRAVQLLPSDRSGISTNLAIPDWNVLDWDFRAAGLVFDDESAPIPGLVFSLDVRRDINYFVYKVFLPLILIVMMSWLVFWIDASFIGPQVSVAVTAMLTMIAYRFALAGMLPKLSFLTTLDYFVMASTVLVFLAMLEVIYTAFLSTHDQLEKARAIDRNARWIAPLVFIAVITVTLILRIGA